MSLTAYGEVNTTWVTSDVWRDRYKAGRGRQYQPGHLHRTNETQPAENELSSNQRAPKKNRGVRI